MSTPNKLRQPPAFTPLPPTDQRNFALLAEQRSLEIIAALDELADEARRLRLLADALAAFSGEAV